MIRKTIDCILCICRFTWLDYFQVIWCHKSTVEHYDRQTDLFTDWKVENGNTLSIFIEITWQMRGQKTKYLIFYLHIRPFLMEMVCGADVNTLLVCVPVLSAAPKMNETRGKIHTHTQVTTGVRWAVCRVFNETHFKHQIKITQWMKCLFLNYMDEATTGWDTMLHVREPQP